MLPLCYAAPMEMKDRESKRGKRREKKSLTQDKLHRELSGKLVRQESNPGPQPLQQARYPNVTTAAQKQKLKLTRDARFPIWGKKFSSDDDMPGSTSNTTLAFASFSQHHPLSLSVPLSLVHPPTFSPSCLPLILRNIKSFSSVLTLCPSLYKTLI